MAVGLAALAVALDQRPRSHVTNRGELPADLVLAGFEGLERCSVGHGASSMLTAVYTASTQPSSPRLIAPLTRDHKYVVHPFTATPWRFHVPVCLAAMENGKHAATEVPAATTIEECWQLVETAERTGRHCVMMENCNYGRWEMMVFHMVRLGIFGEVLHAEGGYLHDLREVKFANHGEGLWRRAHSRTRNANLYPTHGLGPVANCMDIGRGDRFDYVVSMSGPSRGLQDYAREHFPEGAPQRAEGFVLGDVNLSLIKTARGRTITVVHDTNLPRPYSRINLVQGTRGIFAGYPNRVYVEGRSESHRWDDAEKWREEYEHPLWRNVASPGEELGHGQMDYLEDYRLVRCLQEGLPTEMNVYDAAALSAVIDLSERSVADRSRPMDFPDFTRGGWEGFPKLPVVTD